MAADDEDDEDDDEDNPDGASGQVCDSLQDLFRADQYVCKTPDRRWWLSQPDFPRWTRLHGMS